jgi:hypothetical protein
MTITDLRNELRAAKAQCEQAETLYRILSDAAGDHPDNEHIQAALDTAEAAYDEFHADVVFIYDQARAEGIDL